ncbi:MAG: transporter substrate-binding domain-containing protein [Oscillospiraceae bacterium]|nr:transporter substrate-binding domain-containing protein [Oscillospiraceae bacterium]
MKLKKLLAIALALVMVLALCACGSSSSSTTADSSASTDTAAADTSAADTAADDAAAADDTASDDAEEVEETELTTINAGKLTVSMSADFPPYENLDDSGDIVGIEVDIMSLIAEQLGLELQIDDMDFDSALLAVQQGKSDMVVSGVTITEERKLVMNFTDSYTTAVQVIVVPEGSEVTLDNLGDQLIGTQRGTTGFIYCEDDYGSDHVVGYDSYTLVIQALLNGQVDCVVMDDSVARAYVAENPSLSILDTEYAVEEYAFGVDKNNTALLDAVNTVLNALIDDGTVQSIIDQYISE